MGPTTPSWLWNGLWASHALLFPGELRAWWLPHLVRPERVVRYEKMFGGAHAFLPTRDGIAPNTLHRAIHAATAGTLIALALAGPPSG